MKGKLIVFIVAIFAVAVVYIVWRQQMPMEKIRLATSKSGVELSSLIWIANDRGYFKKEGLEVEITPEENGQIAQEKAAAGNADLATASEFTFVSDSFEINNLRIIANIDQAKIVYLVARKDSKINAPSDLKGKKIGITLKSPSEFYLGQFLTFNNILSSQVKIIDIPVTQMQADIISGKVDAVIVNDPFANNIKTALGENGIDWLVLGNQGVSWLVVSNGQFLKTHPQAVERFLSALVLAEKSQLPDLPKHNFTVTLTQSLLVNMENEARWRIANKLTDKTLIPNYLDIIYTDALRKIKPEAVTLY